MSRPPHPNGTGKATPPSVIRSSDRRQTIKEAAHLLGIDPREIACAVKIGAIPLKDAPSRRPRLRPQDLPAIIERAREGGDL